MSNEWFARPVLFVADIDIAIEFYEKQLGFSRAWRYEEERKAYVAQVERQDVHFLWRPYLPLGKLVLLEGDPSAGKTFLALAIASRVTRGRSFRDADDHLRLGRATDWRGKPVCSYGGQVAVAGDRACLEEALVALRRSAK